MIKLWRSSNKEQKGSITIEDRNWGFLRADMHAHILPGLDDGASDIDRSMALLEHMRRSGFERIIATPHINEDIYRNNRTIIENALLLVKQELSSRNIKIEVGAAAEYMIDAGFMDILEQEEPLLAVQDNQVLVEMSYIQESRFLYEALFRLQAKGYRPILAHPERYVYYHGRMDKYRELKDKGCRFQLNAIALSGYYGKEVKKMAEQLLEAGMYDYCGSDAHHERHIRAMDAVLYGDFFPRLMHSRFLNKDICNK